MSILLWIILGGIAGYLASIIMDTDARQSPVMDIVLGVVGALVGGYGMNLLGEPGVNGFNLYSILVAALGAITLIWIGRLLGRNV